MYALRTYFFFLWWCDAVDEERGILRICRRLLWQADVLVTFHEVFTGQGNSKLLPVWTFDVDVLQIIFHLFEDANSNDCAISLRTFAWNAPWYLRIFSTNRKYNFGAKWQSPWQLWILSFHVLIFFASFVSFSVGFLLFLEHQETS